MNIIKEDINELNAVLKVQVGPDDYKTNLNNAIKEYQKKASMPGFRPGKVPSGLIKKMYGKGLLVEELNKLLSNTLENYIKENNLEILGHPLPKADEKVPMDFDNQESFEFLYELGLAPQFNIELSNKEKFFVEKIKIDDTLVDKQITDLSKRYGSIVNPDVVEDGDLVLGDFVELDGAGSVLAGGIFKSSSLAMDRIKNEEVKKKFIGLKKDDKIVIAAKKLSENLTDLSAMLGIDKQKAETLNSDFQFTVKNIGRVKPADINQELFDKVYGPGKVNSPDEFRNKIKEELSPAFDMDSERKLKSTIIEFLLNKIKPSLPDDFLKKWLVSVSEKPVTLDQVGKEYDSYSQSLKWQLIENKILKANNVKVSTEELIEYTKQLIRDQFARYGKIDQDEKEIEATAKQVLENQEEAKKIYDQLYDKHLMGIFKRSFTIENKEVSYEDFYTKAK